jgi:hypothetical protein
MQRRPGEVHLVEVSVDDAALADHEVRCVDAGERDAVDTDAVELGIDERRKVGRIEVLGNVRRCGRDRRVRVRHQGAARSRPSSDAMA